MPLPATSVSSPCAADQRIVAITGAARRAEIREVADDQVVAGSAVERVISGAANKRIVARATF